jgi:hypothetical protein
MVVIRPATPQDNKLLAEIGAETFHDSFAARFIDGQIFSV